MSQVKYVATKIFDIATNNSDSKKDKRSQVCHDIRKICSDKVAKEPQILCHDTRHSCRDKNKTAA